MVRHVNWIFNFVKRRSIGDDNITRLGFVEVMVNGGCAFRQIMVGINIYYSHHSTHLKKRDPFACTSSDCTYKVIIVRLLLHDS